MMRGFREARVTSSADDGRTVFARAVAYNVRDTFGTTWSRGVFGDIVGTPVLWSHQKDRVIGKVTGQRDTPTGLDVTIRLADPDRVPDAAMVQSLLRDDMIPGCSVGFAEGRSRPDPGIRGAVQMIRAKLRELSLVAAPSVPGAVVTGFRSTLDDDVLDDLIRQGYLTREVAAEFRDTSRSDLVALDAELAFAQLDLRMVHAAGQRSVGSSLLGAPRFASPPPGVDFSMTPLQERMFEEETMRQILAPRPTTGERDNRAALPGEFTAELREHDETTVIVDVPVHDPPADLWQARPEGMTAEEAREAYRASLARQR
jgi:HK97 family phage prohead protease